MITFNQVSNDQVYIYDTGFDENEIAAKLNYVDGQWELDLLDGHCIFFIEDLEIIVAKMKELSNKR